MRLLKFLKWLLTMLKVFTEKVYFTHALKSFGLWKIHFHLLKIENINTNKKAKSISTFDFDWFYTTIPHNFQIKVLSPSYNFCLQIKNLKSHWLLKNINLLDIKRLWKKILHMTNFDWCYLHFYHKILFYRQKPSVQTRDWHSISILGRLFYIFLNRNMFSN